VADLVAKFLRRGDDRHPKELQGAAALPDRVGAGDAEHAQGFDGAVLAFWDAGASAVQCGGGCIDRVQIVVFAFAAAVGRSGRSTSGIMTPALARWRVRRRRRTRGLRRIGFRAVVVASGLRWRTPTTHPRPVASLKISVSTCALVRPYDSPQFASRSKYSP
jgi:hypothetical protein